MIEIIFPLSIDKMTDEVSEKKGPKPYIIEPMGDELLCQFFFGVAHIQGEKFVEDVSYEVLEEEASSAKKEEVAKAPHFGASQVVIVRDQSVK